MVPGDKTRFLQAFNRLAVACRLPAAEIDEHMKRIYYDGLADFAVEAVEDSATRIALTADWFPKLAEWRSAAGEARIDSLVKALPPGRDEQWLHECASCEDTGWEEKTCYRGTANNCGRKACMSAPSEGVRPEHGYVYQCSCRPTNRTYQRHHLPKARERFGA
jgi:hypothetical protein